MITTEKNPEHHIEVFTLEGNRWSEYMMFKGFMPYISPNSPTLRCGREAMLAAADEKHVSLAELL